MVVFDCQKITYGYEVEGQGWGLEIGVGGRGWSSLWYGVGGREVVGLVKVFGLEI